jgi:hypothetical protein
MDVIAGMVKKAGGWPLLLRGGRNRKCLSIGVPSVRRLVTPRMPYAFGFATSYAQFLGYIRAIMNSSVE